MCFYTRFINLSGAVLQLIFFLMFVYSYNSAIYAQSDSVKIQPKPDSSKQLLIDSLLKDSLAQDSIKKLVFVSLKSSINGGTGKTSVRYGLHEVRM